MSNVTLVTFYDSYAYNPKLKTGFGFSCLAKINGKLILFDTGSESGILLYNLKQLKIDPKKIDYIILSHSHFDHTGGLSGFLKANGNKAKVIQPTSFPKPTKIFDDVYSTGALGFWIKEQALVIKTKKGLVIITGCSHPGVVNIVKAAQQIDKKVYLVLGGFHINEATQEIKSFKALKVQKIAPCHCTGEHAVEQFKEAYKENFIRNGVGKVISI